MKSSECVGMFLVFILYISACSDSDLTSRQSTEHRQNTLIIIMLILSRVRVYLAMSSGHVLGANTYHSLSNNVMTRQRIYQRFRFDLSQSVVYAIKLQRHRKGYPTFIATYWTYAFSCVRKLNNRSVPRNGTATERTNQNKFITKVLL